MSGKSRMSYIDAMKGIAIVLIVFLHSFMNTESNKESEYAVILNFISYMGVPSFFFINGYLYNHKYSLTPFKSLIKKFKAYYVPFVGFSLFFWLFHNVFVLLHLTPEKAYSIKDYIINFVKVFAMHLESGLNGPMWFLRALLIMVCMFIFIDYFAMKISDRNVRYVVLTVVMLIMYAISESRFGTTAYNMNRVLNCFIFFFVGTVVREYELDKIIARHKTIVFIVGLVIFTINCHFFKGGFGVKEHFLDIPGNVCGILAVFALANYKAIYENRAILFLGSASLDIMSLHFLAFKVPTFIYIKMRNLDIERMADVPVLKGTHGADFILYVICGLAICSAEYYIRSRIMGGRNKKKGSY